MKKGKNMRITFGLLLILLLQPCERAQSPEEHSLPSGPANKPPKPDPAPQSSKSSPDWLSQECLNENYTRLSCSKVFCPPWRRCINGKCICKIPYQCPRLGRAVCGHDRRSYISFCQTQAIACRTNSAMFSHYGNNCDTGGLKVELKESAGQELVQVETAKGKVLICGTKSWDMAAANVICRSLKGDTRGAASAQKKKMSKVLGGPFPSQCIRVSCTGSEYSLAECTIYEPQDVEDDTQIAVLNCYSKPQALEECSEFRCVNAKCISWGHTCDGVDHCGDNSDEMCCNECRSGSFHCKSGVCIPHRSVRDGIRDCLGGEDEVQTAALGPVQTEAVWWSPKEDTMEVRNFTESGLECGIPNMDYFYRTEEETRRHRRKRVVGGQETLPWQIQWQVAVQKEGKIHCGGVYLGGCWVLTAAHCINASSKWPKPHLYRIWFSLWKKHSWLSTTDIASVKSIIVHKDYNPRTYQNDIALVQLQELAFQKECLHPNPGVRPVCVPWSTLQFQHGDTCTISGWGRNKDGDSKNALKWANVTIIGSCKNYYKERFFDGMECAGDLDGKMDSCQGDSGDTLVCKDASGLSYVWGIGSRREKCGESNYPAVYTKVAHYFEWIRFHTGWPAVTKYNH